MKQNFAETVRVDELAERANMSPSTFRQHVRTITGMSPMQFQKRLRQQEARQLMLNESASAAAASALVATKVRLSSIANTDVCSKRRPNVMCGTCCRSDV